MTATMPDVEWHAVDLCAGPGGWDVACQRLGIDALGFEIDEAAILTRDAAGHATAIVSCDDPNHPCPDLGSKTHAKTHPRRVRGLSMTEVDPRVYFVRGHGKRSIGIASPPCQGFSMAGTGKARQDSARLLAELEPCRTAADVAALIASASEWMSHAGTALVLEPLRWALAATPSALAWEQVPAVLPIWEACAVILRRVGYDVVTGNVQAEQYGVPQTRKRAVLLARAPWLTAELGPLRLPTPTHSRYHSRTPDKIDAGLPRWVSMAEALEWGMTERPSVTVPATSGAGGPRALDGGSGARAIIKEAQEEGRWRYNADDEPILDGSEAVWENRPATTVVASFRPDMIAGPGFRGPGDGPRQKAKGSIRVEPHEAAVLQSFPADYPFQGTKTKVFQQIGNAIPPLLAEALLCEVVGRPFRPAPVAG